LIDEMHTGCTSAVNDSLDDYISRSGKDSHIQHYHLKVLVVSISNAIRVNEIFLCASSLHVLKACPRLGWRPGSRLRGCFGAVRHASDGTLAV